MRSLASPSLFRTFDLLLSEGNPGLKLWHWQDGPVAWSRERHSFNGAAHGFAVEVTTLTHGGRQGWTLMVVKEFWWMGTDGKDVRSWQWARLLKGRRKDALEWIKQQERRLEVRAQESAFERVPDDGLH